MWCVCTFIYLVTHLNFRCVIYICMLIVILEILSKFKFNIILFL